MSITPQEVLERQELDSNSTKVAASTFEPEEVTEQELEFVSNEEYLDLLLLAINDAQIWIGQARRLIDNIEDGKPIKGTKLNGAVRNSRLLALRSSLVDVQNAKIVC